MATIEEYIKQGILPVISEDRYRSVGVKVNLPINDYKYEIKDQKELDRLLYNSEINRALLEGKARMLESSFISEYDNLIQKGKDNVDKATELGYTDEVPGMNETVNALQKIRNERISTIIHYDAGMIDSIISEGLLEGSKLNRFNKNHNKMYDLDSELKERYEQESKLNDTLAKARTNFKKNRTKKRLEKLHKKIQKLRTKQGKLMNQQALIVSAAIKKYKEIREQQFKEYANALKSDKNYLENRSRIEEALDSIKNDMEITNNNLENSNLNKFQELGQRIDLAVLKYRKNQLERDRQNIEKLRNLQSRIKGLDGKTRAVSPGVPYPTRTAALVH